MIWALAVLLGLSLGVNLIQHTERRRERRRAAAAYQDLQRRWTFRGGVADDLRAQLTETREAFAAYRRTHHDDAAAAAAARLLLSAARERLAWERGRRAHRDIARVVREEREASRLRRLSRFLTAADDARLNYLLERGWTPKPAGRRRNVWEPCRPVTFGPHYHHDRVLRARAAADELRRVTGGTLYTRLQIPGPEDVE